MKKFLFYLLIFLVGFVLSTQTAFCDDKPDMLDSFLFGKSGITSPTDSNKKERLKNGIWETQIKTRLYFITTPNKGKQTQDPSIVLVSNILSSNDIEEILQSYKIHYCTVAYLSGKSRRWYTRLKVRFVADKIEEPKDVGILCIDHNINDKLFNLLVHGNIYSKRIELIPKGHEEMGDFLKRLEDTMTKEMSATN